MGEGIRGGEGVRRREGRREGGVMNWGRGSERKPSRTRGVGERGAQLSE